MNKSISDNNFVQSNSLITASYEITLQEKRLIIAILGKYNQSKELPQKCTLKASEFAYLFKNIKLNFYKELTKAVDLLYERDIRYLNDKNNKKRFRWVQSIEYNDFKSEVILEWSNSILPLISQLKTQFTQIKIKEITKLRSIYSIRLFELVQEKKKFGEFVITIADFRKMFKLETKYPRFESLRTRVIEPAIKEIFIKNNLKIDFKADKMGRSYKYLYFTWDKKVDIPERLKITKVTDLDEPNLFDDNSK